jgi:hypothetical protein
MPFATYKNERELQPIPLPMIPDFEPRGEDFPGEYYNTTDYTIPLEDETYRKILEVTDDEFLRNRILKSLGMGN